MSVDWTLSIVIPCSIIFIPLGILIERFKLIEKISKKFNINKRRAGKWAYGISWVIAFILYFIVMVIVQNCFGYDLLNWHKIWD